MKIDGYRPVGGASGTKSNAKIKKSSGFSDSVSASDEDGADASSGVMSAAQVSGLSSLMQLQEVRLPTYTNKAVFDYAEDILQGLDSLQQGILSGVFDGSQLKAIETQINNIPKGQHPSHITELLALIKQRAAVELAKLEMSKLR